MNRTHMYTSVNTGIHQAVSIPIERDEIVARCVSCLHGRRGPYAVIFGITKIVVQSIKTMTFARAWSHVSKEILEVLPSRINRDTATSVMFVHSMIRARSASDHAIPSRVFRASPGSSAMPMFLSRIIFQAPTGLCMATTKLRNSDARLVPTYAFAYPVDTIRVSVCTTNHGQPSKGLAGHVYSARPKLSLLTTTARFCMAIFKIYSLYKSNLSTAAATFPASFSTWRVAAATKYCKVVKLFSSEFESVHGIMYIMEN